MNLLPLTVIQLTLVCFLLYLFSPTGEICCSFPRLDIRLPTTVNGDELDGGPVVELSPTKIRVDGSVAASAAEVGDALSKMKRAQPLLHPGEPFDGRVVVSADRSIPWRRLREILAAA